MIRVLTERHQSNEQESRGVNQRPNRGMKMNSLDISHKVQQRDWQMKEDLHHPFLLEVMHQFFEHSSLHI
jgi:hypothetical protein